MNSRNVTYSVRSKPQAASAPTQPEALCRVVFTPRHRGMCDAASPAHLFPGVCVERSCAENGSATPNEAPVASRSVELNEAASCTVHHVRVPAWREKGLKAFLRSTVITGGNLPLVCGHLPACGPHASGAAEIAPTNLTSPSVQHPMEETCETHPDFCGPFLFFGFQGRNSCRAFCELNRSQLAELRLLGLFSQ